KLPVVAAFRCQDLIDNSSPSYAGDAGVGMPPHIRSFLEESDLIVCINARFGEMLTDAWTLFDPTTFDTPLIHIHAGEAELGKIFTPEIAVMSCPNAACTMLSRTEHLSDPVWAERTVQQHDVWAATIDAPQQTGAVDMAEVMQIIRDTLPVDAIVTNGAGNFAIWPGRHIVYGRDMTMLAPQSGAMGAGVPAAIMAKLVQPDRFALSFAGDGDFQMNCQELGTAMQHDAAPVILVLNNGTYGTIRMHQERDYPRRVSGTEIVNPDFAALAQSYGFHGETVRETSDFADAWKRACASPTGAVLELVTDAEAITPRTTISALRGDG
ncbi:MAG: thiamine pyrophosphate-dependent enzyme, partial [Pseudomonadota bacterium]